MRPAGAVAVALVVVLTGAAVGGLHAQQGRGKSPPEGLDLYMPPPAGGPEGSTLVELGRDLFLDPVLSRDSTLACASCHMPDRAFSNGRVVSRGIGGRVGRRNVPTLVNRGYGRAFSWDGRRTTLEAQVLAPIEAHDEMDLEIERLIIRLRAQEPVRRRFRSALGREPDRDGLARALASYVRSIRSGGSAFDRFLGGDTEALTERQIRGMELFQGPARCARCHFGPLLTDESFHNTGVAWRQGEPSDSGRARITGRAEDVGAFKTPTLREVSRTAPYMHDGSLGTLEEVVEFYEGGGHPNPALDALVQPLDLGPRDRAALVDFLRALEGRVEEGGISPRPRPAPSAAAPPTARPARPARPRRPRPP